MDKISLVSQALMPFCFYTAKDIADLTGIDIRTVRSCLDRLVYGEIANVEKRGPENIYTTNQKQLF